MFCFVFLCVFSHLLVLFYCDLSFREVNSTRNLRFERPANGSALAFLKNPIGCPEQSCRSLLYGR